MNPYIKTLIDVNKDAVDNIAVLENTVKEFPITDEKSKTNFGNLCILLKGYRLVADASECLLINENVLKDDKGDYYQKVEDDDPIVPSYTEGKTGSDFDKDDNGK